MVRRVDRFTPNELVRMGVCQVMEGRHCFPHLTIEENLLGAEPAPPDVQPGSALRLMMDVIYPGAKLDPSINRRTPHNLF